MRRDSGSSDGPQRTQEAFLRNEDTIIEPPSLIRRFVSFFVRSMYFQIVVTVLSLYSLFADNIRVAWFTSQADLGFDIVNLIIFCIFWFDIFLTWIINEEYRMSFYFGLDICATISLLFDISIFTDVIFKGNSSNVTLNNFSTQNKASQAATSALSIIKLFRIVRIVRLYKSTMRAQQIKKEERQKELALAKAEVDHKKRQKRLSHEKSADRHNLSSPTANDGVLGKLHDVRKSQQGDHALGVDSPSQTGVLFDEDKSNEQNPFPSENTQGLQGEIKESKISKLLSAMTIQKIVVVLLLLVFIVPLFGVETYTDRISEWDFTISRLKEQLEGTSPFPSSNLISLISPLVKSKTIEVGGDLVYFSTPFQKIDTYVYGSLYELRSNEVFLNEKYIDTTAALKNNPKLTLRKDLPVAQQNMIYLAISDRKFIQIDAQFSIGKTIFIVAVLLILLELFSSNIDVMIVKPIELMVKKLLKMARDPQSVSQQELESDTLYETSIVSNAIIKIGALLSIVFGSAGAEIIGSNIVMEGDVNPLLQGAKKCAIFGFCDIRKFSDVTDVLQEDILFFVNRIGLLVHEAVYRYGGSANKNIGEAFLLVWKIPGHKYEIELPSNNIIWKDRTYLSVLADFSVFSFIKAIIKINKDPEILAYRKDQALLEKFGTFKVDMGFGLHIGWAIEGAIGSEYKIDASYLSPNVNMASRLEAATKQFGVDLLISEELYEMLTPSMKKFCRNIDRVTVKGSNKPIRLYTIDMNLDKITPPADKEIKYPNAGDRPDIESKRQANLEWLKEEQIHNYNAQSFVRSKKELSQVMINAVPENFKRTFAEGMTCYVEGRWKDAKLHNCSITSDSSSLIQAQKIVPDDGPTKKLLNYLTKFDFIAPDNWKNFRQLTSK